MTFNNINKKYGGDFEYNENWLLNIDNQFLSDFSNYILFDTGRSALLNILKNIHCKKVLLPNYICQSIADVFLSVNAEIVFYNINRDFTIDIESLRSNHDSTIDTIFFINYFGTIQPETTLQKIKEFAENNNIKIIEDTTHSIFSNKHTIGDYCVASLRKWFSIPDGAIAYSNKYTIKNYSVDQYNIDYVNLRKQAMILKAHAIENNSDNESYLDYFEKSEQFIEKQSTIHKISDYSLNILKKYNLQTMIKKRKENFIFMETHLKNKKLTPLMHSNNVIAPLFYPVLIQNRDEFRKYLFSHNIFCPVHWPQLQNLGITNYFAWNYQKQILSLLIDQRYDIKDMERIITIINTY